MITTRSKQSGLLLVEVLVTLMIMSVGLLGLAGLQSTSLKDNLAVAQRSQVTWLVTELVERMRANPDALYAADAYVGSINDCDTAGAVVSACSDRNTSSNASNCSANQIAAFDRWEVFCGQPAPADDVITNSPDSLNLDSVTISCEASCNILTDDYLVDIAWTSKVTQNINIKTSGAALPETRRIRMNVRP